MRKFGLGFEINMGLSLTKIDTIIDAIKSRQSMPWDGNLRNHKWQYDYKSLQDLFDYVNSDVHPEDYFYHGDIFRIHCAHSTWLDEVDNKNEYVISKSSDGSCSVLPKTHYSSEITAFSKNYDFTRDCWYKICKYQQAIIFHVNTNDMYGIDVNAFLHKYGHSNERFEDEQEILFPLDLKYVMKEYHCTPNQFNYYMRKLI